MRATFEIIGQRVQASARPGDLAFERVLTLLDADPHCPLQHTVDYALTPDEEAAFNEQWLGRILLMGVNEIGSGYGGRVLFRGRIAGFQSQRSEAPAEEVPARRQQIKDSPDVWILSGVRWQFFGTLTFKQERLPERKRDSMFNAALRQLADTQHLYFPRLPWCRREELGELLGRRHYHFLLTGLPARNVNLSTCFFLMHTWEKRGGGMARVRLYDQAQDGLGYIAKCLSGEDAYETAKFAEGPSHLTLSDGLQRMLRIHPVMGERRLAQRNRQLGGGSSSVRQANGQL